MSNYLFMLCYRSKPIAVICAANSIGQVNTRLQDTAAVQLAASGGGGGGGGGSDSAVASTIKQIWY